MQGEFAAVGCLSAGRSSQHHGNITARHGTARHGTARHGTARHGTARHGTARHGTARQHQVNMWLWTGCADVH